MDEKNLEGHSCGNLLISALAEHTRNLRADPRCSLLVAEEGDGNPLARGRVTLLGEAFFAVAFVTSIMYLVADSREKKGIVKQGAISAEKLDSISYRCVAIGFPLFTLGGLVFGMVWAYKAWGTYWSWDPKETWSLITWFVFALYLHTRIVMGWKGRRSALIAIIGFLAAIFTYFGVNYLLAGLHSYA